MTRQEEKQQLRAIVRRLEAALAPEYKAKSARSIAHRLLAMPEYQEAQTVFCFVGTDREIDTRPILEDALAAGKTLCVPLCTEPGHMESRQITDLNQLVPGRYGLLEPTADTPVSPVDAIDFAVLPCVTCNYQGHRLGHGGGYYDRFLSQYRGGTVLLCRELLIRQEIPVEPHDYPVPWVLTERGLYEDGIPAPSDNRSCVFSFHQVQYVVSFYKEGLYMIVQDTMQYLSQLDPEVGASVQEEFARQQRNIELIASENIVSPAVMVAMGTCLTNKYAEGYPGHRYYGGCFAVDVTEELARQRACQLFGCKYANVQPHSGANANLAAFFALAQPGDTILGMNLAHGGHLSHGSPVNISGKYFHIVPYGLGEDETIDYDALLETAKACQPKIIIAGASAYPRVIDFAKFREVADAVGAYLMVDMAHIAGLVAAGLHPSPIPYADVVTTTTHKTLRGPRGGLILCNDETIYKKINSAVFPGTQGGPLEHIIAAKAVCFGEALKPEFKAYAEQIVKNAKVLAEELVKEGFRLVSGGTDNHLCLVDVRNFHITGKEFERRLDEVQLTVNKNAIPNDPEKPFVTSGVRVGTPAVTSRGFKEPEMVQIAHWMGQTARDFDTCREQVRSEVDALCRKFPIYQ